MAPRVRGSTTDSLSFNHDVTSGRKTLCPQAVSLRASVCSSLIAPDFASLKCEPAKRRESLPVRTGDSEAGVLFPAP